MIFYGYDTQSATNKSKNQLGIYQTKNFFITKETVNKMRKQLIKWRK